MSYKNPIPARDASFDPFSAGVLSSTDAQSAIDEIAGRLPPPPPDCSAFSGQSAVLADTIGNEVSAAAQIRNQQTTINIQLLNGGLSQAEIDALNAELSDLQTQLDAITAQIAIDEAARAAADAAYQACQGGTPSVGGTASRPVNPATGFPYFDTDLGIPVWFRGVSFGWVNASGAQV